MSFANTAGYNWFLIVIVVVITLLSVVVNVYLLVNFMHPEDRNTAWIPKIVTVFGLTIAELSVLMLPLDVGNRNSCAQNVVLSACAFALPMAQLWEAMYIIMMCMMFFIIPFTMFFYEADSDLSFGQKLWYALQYVLITAVVIALCMGIGYGIGGYIDYDIYQIFSGIAPLSVSTGLQTCILELGGLYDQTTNYCDGLSYIDKSTFSARCSIIVYMIALSTIAGWLMFMIFAGVGMVALPTDFIQSWIFRPTATITRAQYIKECQGFYRRAKGIKVRADELRKEERSKGRSRAWRRQYNMINLELVALETEEEKLLETFPQGEQADVTWVATVMWYAVRFVVGILSVCLTIMWLLQIIIYMLFLPPLHPLLNDMFIALDSVFSLFGTFAFALFSFYLIFCVIKGNMALGLNFLFFTVHPMKVNGTLMSSFLFNTGLVMACSLACIQFCASAFDLYANETAINTLFADQVLHLRGLKYLFIYNIFIYSLLACVGLGGLMVAFWKPVIKTASQLRLQTEREDNRM